MSLPLSSSFMTKYNLTRRNGVIFWRCEDKGQFLRWHWKWRRKSIVNFQCRWFANKIYLNGFSFSGRHSHFRCLCIHQCLGAGSWLKWRWTSFLTIEWLFVDLFIDSQMDFDCGNGMLCTMNKQTVIVVQKGHGLRYMWSIGISALLIFGMGVDTAQIVYCHAPSAVLSKVNVDLPLHQMLIAYAIILFQIAFLTIVNVGRWSAGKN